MCTDFGGKIIIDKTIKFMHIIKNQPNKTKQEGDTKKNEKNEKQNI